MSLPEQMIRQTTFTLGEVDQTTWKRSDVSEYLTAAQSLLNMEVGTIGLAKKRKGTSILYNATGLAQEQSRMYEFIDKFGVSYLVMSTGTGTWYAFLTPTGQRDVIADPTSFVLNNTGDNVVVDASNLQLYQPIPGLPYGTGDLNDIDYTQDNDSLILAHQGYAPGRIYISAYNPGGFPTFAFQYINIYPLPAYDFNTVNYNSFTVTLSVTNSVITFNITNPAGATGFTTAWIGGQIVGGGASDIDPIGYAIITAVSNSGNTTTFTGLVQVPFQTTGYAVVGSQYSIKQPAFGGTSGFPAATIFYQNRLWFANTPSLNNTIFGSKINQPINFDVGVGRDTDAIVYSIGQTNTGSIYWMNGGKQLEIYTQNNEFACPQDQNSGLTPSTFSIRQQSSFGASNALKPITYINDSYYSSKTGKAFINFHFNGIGLTYTSSNISAASNHLIKAPINRALLRGSDTSQDNFIYLLNPDNTITAFQFATEYKLAAFTPFIFEQNVNLIDIVTIGNVIYILKYYVLTDQFTIEIFDDSTRMDTTFSATMQTSGLVTGLNLLNGYMVQVVYQGQDFGQYIVGDPTQGWAPNTIVVNNPQALSGTVLIGLLYDVALIPMYPYSGSTQSPFKKQVQRIYVDYYQSLVFSINNDIVPYQNFADIQAGLPLTPQTDTAIIDPFSGWNRFDNDGTPIIAITQTAPFDLQILSIGYQVASAVI